MRAIRKRRPSPALVVATIALIVAMGGTGYAAFKVPKNSVGTKQLKNGAVTSKKLNKNAVIGHAVLATVAGSANPVAFAHVNLDGTLDNANTKNVSSSLAAGSSLNIYCLRGIPFTVRGGQATVDEQSPGDQVAQFFAGRDPHACPAGTQATVLTFTAFNGDASPAPFYVEMYG